MRLLDDGAGNHWMCMPKHDRAVPQDEIYILISVNVPNVRPARPVNKERVSSDTLDASKKQAGLRTDQRLDFPGAIHKPLRGLH